MILGNLKEMRMAIFTADAWRSFGFLLVGLALLIAYRKNLFREQTLVLCVGVLCLIDLYGVNRRYLNDDNFAEPRSGAGIPRETEADRIILQSCAEFGDKYIQ